MLTHHSPAIASRYCLPGGVGQRGPAPAHDRQRPGALVVAGVREGVEEVLAVEVSTLLTVVMGACAVSSGADGRRSTSVASGVRAQRTIARITAASPWRPRHREAAVDSRFDPNLLHDPTCSAPTVRRRAVARRRRRRPSTSSTPPVDPSSRAWRRREADDVTQAIDAAAGRRQAWSAPPLRRSARAVLRRWYDLIVEHADDLATILTAEQGKPWPRRGGRSSTARASSSGTPRRPSAPTARSSRRTWPADGC